MTEDTRRALQVNRELIDALPASDVRQRGALIPQTVGEAMEFAKLLSAGRASLPGFLQGNPADCLRVVSISMRTGLDPFFLADQAYLTESRGGEKRMSFMSQAVHAIVLSSGVLDGEPELKFAGEGENLTVTVTAKRRGGRTHSETYRLATIKVRNSPLWASQPRQQLGYYGIRAWCRLHAPEALGGIVAAEEAGMLDVTPQVVTDTPTTATDRVASLLGGGDGAVGRESTAPHERAVDFENTVMAERAGAAKRTEMLERAAEYIDKTTGEIRQGLEAQRPLDEPSPGREPKSESEPELSREPKSESEPEAPTAPHRPSDTKPKKADPDKRLAAMMTHIATNATTLDDLVELLTDERLDRAVQTLPADHQKRWFAFLQKTEDDMRAAEQEEER